MKRCETQGERLWNAGRKYSEVVEWHSTALHNILIAVGEYDYDWLNLGQVVSDGPTFKMFLL